MHPILPIFQSIIIKRGHEIIATPSKFTINGRVDIVFRDIIGMIPTSTDFIPHRFNILASFLRVHGSDDPDIQVLKCHKPFVEVDDHHAIIIPPYP